MRNAYPACAASSLLLALVTACGSSTPAGGKGSSDSTAKVAQGAYSCHALVFAGAPFPLSFPKLTLQAGDYSIAGRTGGTYTASGSPDPMTIAFTSGLLNGAHAKYDATAHEITFGGPSESHGIISDASGLVCTLT